MKATIADIVREHGRKYLAKSGNYSAERRILSDIERCRTAALGGHRYQCTQCGRQEIAYNSCRNRHCPQCLGSKTSKWLAARVSELLPVKYYHCVFTLPAQLRQLVLTNRVVVYDILFSAAAQTLKEVARNPKHLGADIGFFGILHTWTQTLEFHPHLHFVVPGGGLSNGQWIEKKNKQFFLPVKVLSRVFRGKFIHELKHAHKNNKIKCLDIESLLNSSCHSDWVVYCKPPFAGPDAVLKYLSRYTHRIAMSNARIVSLKNAVVSFVARAKKQGSGQRVIKLQACEFIRRFLLHRIPRSFTRIRHFGLLANKGRKQTLELLKNLLKAPTLIPPPQKPWLKCACGCSIWLIIAPITPCNST